MTGSFVRALFDEAPPGTFAEGYVFIASPDLTEAETDPDAGYWHCDIAGEDRLTWSAKVYELFGLPTGSPIVREQIVALYEACSREALQRVRKYALSRAYGFILDAAIEPAASEAQWIRILAVPILAERRIGALHGLKRKL